jgi:ABC-type branched-subunit amino acid transport system substrate-binding protein
VGRSSFLNGPARYRLWACIVTCMALAGLLAACGSNSSSSSGSTASTSSGSKEGDTVATESKCGGEPVKFMAIAELSERPGSTGGPSFTAGAKAAAAAVNKDCELGRPIEVVECSDEFNSNGAAACGRDAVSEKALAAVFVSCCGDNIMPPLEQAGIPSFNTAASQAENTSPTSFPLVFAASNVMGEITTAVSLGSDNVALVVANIPALNFFVELASAQAKALGAKATIIRVPVTTTDYTSVAAQVLSAGADGVVPVLGAGPDVTLAKALVAQGADFSEGMNFIDDLSNLNPKTVEQLGPEVEGITPTSFAWSPTETKNPAIQQYISELEESGQPTEKDDLTTYGVMAWAAVHIAADALKGHKVTSKELMARLNTPGVVESEKYGLPPIDYTKPAYPNPPLSELRTFSKDISAWQFDSSGTPQPLDSGWMDVTERFLHRQAAVG